MGTIYIARIDAEQTRLRAPPLVHAWTVAAARPAALYSNCLERIPDSPPRWAYGEEMMRALRAWLSALRWTDSGEISYIELAVDFEIFTGIDIPRPRGDGPAPVNQRGKALWTILSALCRICRDLQLTSPLPAERE